MATTDKYLRFDIRLTDKALLATLQAAHPGGVFISPNQAAVTYASPPGVPLGVQLTTDPIVNPGLRSEWFIAGSEYPRDVQEFQRKSGGWFGLSFLFGNTTRYHWYGMFVLAGNTTDGAGLPPEVVAIAKRRWLIGFEGLNDAEITSIGTVVPTREASRHVDGLGWNANGTAEVTASHTQSGDAATNKLWDRFYFRCVEAPTSGPARMWRVRLNGGASRGGSINFTTDRRLVFHNISDTGVETALGTTSEQYELNQWYRVDVLWEAKNPGGNVRVYIGKEQVLSVVAPNGTGMGTTDTGLHSVLGPGALGLGTTGRFFYDDWIGAEWPTQGSGGVEHFPGLDWMNGSRVALAPAHGLATGNAWTGSYFNANQFLDPGQADANAKMTSVVSGDAQRLTVNSQHITGVNGTLGVVAFLVAWFGRQTVAGNGTIGWKFDGLIDLATHVEGNVVWSRRWHRPSGATVPIANFTPFELHKIKAANVNAADCWAFVLIAEHIGIFGDEDVPADEATAPESNIVRRGIHNAPYPGTSWAKSNTAVPSPVVIHTGTYTGNGTVQELQFRAPVGWLMIIRTPSVSTGGMWWSSMVHGHVEGQRGGPQAAGMPVQAMIDPSLVLTGALDQQEQRTIVRITGDNSQVNAAAVVYQYIAFEDPGSRYHINGAHHVDVAQHPSELIPLGHSTFVPRYVFMHGEHPNNAATTYDRAIKGPGHAAGFASIMNLAENASGWDMAAGELALLGLGVSTSGTSKAWSAWRNDDQSTDPEKLNVVAIGTYVGDGAASRTITFGSSGKRPVYAIVTPHSATPSHHRSPFNLTNTSNAMGTGSSTTTGITAGGIDSFTVGSTLNANGVTFEYFVLIGGVTACNGGWSCDGEFTVVEPDSPADGDYDDPGDINDPDPAPDPDPDPDPGPTDEDDCEAGDVCVAATTREVNRALLEIGNTKFLTNYCTQTTLEAQTARLLYESSVRAVLHAFPWPFATRYAALALSATQPSNQDWAFSYRQPIDCIFERRLVVARATGVDPAPPPMELSSDTSGGLILTNQPAAVLEYTCRPACVAFAGDALFKEALVWHLAAKLAPPLTRMADKAKFCMEQYELCIAKANAILRPDDPGLRVTPAWQAQDVGAGAMAANVEVANLALVKIGARTIAALSPDQSREAAAVNLVFEHELRATLRDYSWKFAKRYDTALVLVGGTDTVPVNPDWQYSYRLPADYVAVRRLPTDGTGRSFEREPNTFEVSTDAVGDLLFTNVMTDVLNLEYTARIANAVLRSDHLFREALGWRLAAALAPSLAQPDPEVQEQIGRGPESPPDNTQRVSHKPSKAAARVAAQRWAFSQYLRAIEKARFADANESEPEADGDAEWIEGRQ